MNVDGGAGRRIARQDFPPVGSPSDPSELSKRAGAIRVQSPRSRLIKENTPPPRIVGSAPAACFTTFTAVSIDLVL